MRWLVTGAAGMLGRDVVELLRRSAHDVTAAGRDDVDVTDPEAVRRAVDGHDVVVNCAAWTDVDGAETHEAEALRLNADAPRHLAAACRTAGALLVHPSTDYVFGDRRGDDPWPEDAAPAPLSAYGRSKAAGEDAVRSLLPGRHLVVRTAWLYGAHGRCFPRTIARLAAERDRLPVVDDQVGQPTWTVDVADLVLRLVDVGAPAGTYHATSDGVASWHEFAQAVAEEQGLDPARVRETTSEAYRRPAPRPAYSVLGHDALRAAGVEPIGDWRERFAVAAPVVLGADVGAAAR
jgi:dTDP-4-dehydrorhamnose reductase